jgi:hypothetical protein
MNGYDLLNLAKLLWKRVESAFTQEHYGNAEAWCHVCLHVVFEKAGAQNKAKVARLVLRSCKRNRC